MKKPFDRNELIFYPLADRINRVYIDDLENGGAATAPGSIDSRPDPESLGLVAPIAEAIQRAKGAGADRVAAFGAHTIKNGMGPIIGKLISKGWFSHCATNGAGIIHDWELAYQGATSEHVQENVAIGRFGMWEETGRLINLAINVGAYRGWGYGESVGHLVEDDGLVFPGIKELREAMAGDDLGRAAAAADLLDTMKRLAIEPGKLEITHRHAAIGLQAAALRLGVSFTAHPMFGHDIIYTHPACSGAAIGRTAERDFLSFAGSIAGLEGGVYLSVGSAVMSPMIFEKSLSMARNRAIQSGRAIDDFDIYVVDLAEMKWDWSNDGEPPPDDPAYYVRFCKSFSRMGGRFTYVRLDAGRLFRALEFLLG